MTERKHCERCGNKLTKRKTWFEKEGTVQWEHRSGVRVLDRLTGTQFLVCTRCKEKLQVLQGWQVLT